MRARTRPTYEAVRARGSWTGRGLSSWEWAFLEYHRLHDEVEAARQRAIMEAKWAGAALDLVAALKTEDFNQANSLLDAVRTRLFGDAARAGEGDPVTMTFRNSSSVFSYDLTLAQDETFPSDEELAEFLSDGEDA